MKKWSTAEKIHTPTLAERVEALMEELETALDQLTKERQISHTTTNACGEEETVRLPLSSLRRMLDAQGFGDCKCRSYLVAIKES